MTSSSSPDRSFQTDPIRQATSGAVLREPFCPLSLSTARSKRRPISPSSTACWWSLSPRSCRTSWPAVLLSRYWPAPIAECSGPRAAPRHPFSVRSKYTKGAGGIPLSIRKWIREGRGVLFLPHSAGQIAALKNLIATWVRVAIFETMSLGEGDHRIWFAIDESGGSGSSDRFSSLISG